MNYEISFFFFAPPRLCESIFSDVFLQVLYGVGAGMGTPENSRSCYLCVSDVLVSWNFKHIVNFQKIKLFNSVNLREGYGILDIRTPQEVIDYER